MVRRPLPRFALPPERSQGGPLRLPTAAPTRAASSPSLPALPSVGGPSPLGGDGASAEGAGSLSVPQLPVMSPIVQGHSEGESEGGGPDLIGGVVSGLSRLQNSLDKLVGLMSKGDRRDYPTQLPEGGTSFSFTPSTSPPASAPSMGLPPALAERLRRYGR